LPFHVFIERAKDPSPAGKARLAAAIAQRYKLPEASVGQALTAGRLRVKTNIDLETAKRFVAELDTLGAICAIVDVATNQPVAAPAPAPPPAPAPAPSPSTSGKYESGLSAAFTSNAAASDSMSLGAFDKLGSGGLSVASLDGAEQEEMDGPAGFSVAAPASAPKAPPAAAKPAAVAKGSTAPAAPAAPAANAFDAPDAEKEAPLELGPSPAKPAPPPKPKAKAAEPEPPPAPAAPAPQPFFGTDNGRGDLVMTPPTPSAPIARPATPRPVPRPPIDGGPLARFFVGKEIPKIFAGVIFALLLGFIPAHLYASSAEDSRFGEIRKDITSVQKDVTSKKAWDALDATRDQALKDMSHARGRIEVVAAILWIGVASGLGWAWFKKLT
jgi:hypothetical protein